MADVMGMDVTGIPSMPKIDLTGFLSGTWIYILIVGVLGVLLVVAVGLILYYKTYNKQVIIFREGFKSGIEKKTRARTIMVNRSGYSVMKLLAGGEFAPSNSIPMYARTYWFERGRDGYLRNIVLTPTGEINYIHTEVRGFYEGINMQSKNNYGEKKTTQKIVIGILIFLFFAGILIGNWVVAGKQAEASRNFNAASEKIADAVDIATSRASSCNTVSGGSGIVPAS